MTTRKRKEPSTGEETEGFIVERMGPSGVFGVFEDDGETGWLYLYQPDRATDGQNSEAILHARHVYNRTNSVAPTETDVAVVWSDDVSKCGIVVWGKMRAIIDFASRRDHAAALNDRQSVAIVDAQWLTGFTGYELSTER